MARSTGRTGGTGGLKGTTPGFQRYGAARGIAAGRRGVSTGHSRSVSRGIPVGVARLFPGVRPTTPVGVYPTGTENIPRQSNYSEGQTPRPPGVVFGNQGMTSQKDVTLPTGRGAAAREAAVERGPNRGTSYGEAQMWRLEPTKYLWGNMAPVYSPTESGPAWVHPTGAVTWGGTIAAQLRDVAESRGVSLAEVLESYGYPAISPGGPVFNFLNDFVLNGGGANYMSIPEMSQGLSAVFSDLVDQYVASVAPVVPPPSAESLGGGYGGWNLPDYGSENIYQGLPVDATELFIPPPQNASVEQEYSQAPYWWY